jgi:hypothetical protein
MCAALMLAQTTGGRNYSIVLATHSKRPFSAKQNWQVTLHPACSRTTTDKISIG